MRAVLAAISIAFIALAAGLPYEEDPDYDYETDNKEIENDADSNTIQDFPTPTFTTESSNMIVNEGDTVRLPCIVDRLEGFVMLWKRGQEIITVANQIIDKNVRLEELKNGNYLILSQVTPEDGGRFTCQISAFKPTEIHHDLVVRTRPVLAAVPEEVVVREGSHLALECRAVSGSPQPKLALVGPDQVDVSPHLTVEEERLVLEVEEVTREMAGLYTCTADNGFDSSPAQWEVTVHVEYKPDLEISESFILTDLAEQQEIHCTVDSYPPVMEMDWALDGSPITLDTPELEISSSGSQFTLTIPEVRLNSTGEYSCTASNSVGTSTASALVTGEARPAVILSGPESEQEDSYQLVWSVASRAPVNSSVVSVRRQGEELWTKHDVNVSDDNEAFNATEDDEDYTGALTLTDLKPGTTYEVSVATRNSFGLVDHGNIFTFTTKKETGGNCLVRRLITLPLFSEELLKETDEEEEGREKESHQGDVDSQRAVTTGVATEVRPLITPVILACLASFTTL